MHISFPPMHSLKLLLFAGGVTDVHDCLVAHFGRLGSAVLS